MLPIYVGQYGLFGDARVLPVKVLWDYTYYWGVLCQLFFQRRLTDLAAIGRLRTPLARAERLNGAVQAFLREWSHHSDRRNPPQLLDQASLPWFAELNRGLTDTLDDAAFQRRMADSFAQLDALAAEMVEHATAEHPRLDGSGVLALLDGTARRPGARMLFPDSAVTAPAAC